MVRRIAFAVPGDLATPTGGYAYDRRMIAELDRLGWTVDVLALGEGFPRPDAQTKTQAEARLAAVPPGIPIVIDGLAFGVLPEAANALLEGGLHLVLVPGIRVDHVPASLLVLSHQLSARCTIHDSTRSTSPR